METLHVGQLCWFSKTNKEIIWEEAKIVRVGEVDVTVCPINGNNIIISKSLVYSKNDGDGSSSDVTTLHHLNRPAILHALLHRYTKGNIYTYSGAILIALNPYKNVRGLYGTDIMEKAHQGLGASEPHVYNVVERAYRAMRRSGISQSILVSGESGAGKTESTKHVLSYLAYITASVVSNTNSTGSNTGSSIKDKILASTPLLEALGNAKTVYNDNSSRFGKYIRVLFDSDGGIIGASIQTYLLERSRIVKPKPYERNFHVFYQIIRSLSKEKRSKYFVVDNTNVYKYLQGSETEQHDEDDYKKTLDALNKLGFTQEEQDMFHLTLSSILALGNVEFKEEGKDIVISEPKWLHLVSSLLNCEEDILKNALTQRLVTVTHGMNAGTPGSVYVSKHTKAKCEQSRDSMAMMLYTKLMNWVVKRINEILKPINNTSNNTSIGVLDIYGFESFERNGLDQLCINYANEKLQRQFNQQVFTKELEEYRNEGIDCESINYSDNSNVIDAIEGTSNVPGVAQYLDDQSKVAGGGNDGAFVRSLLASNVDKSVLRKPDKGSIDSFMICHYADRVTYTGDGFVERNTDYVVDEHMTVLKRTSCPLFKIFEEDPLPTPNIGRGKSGSNASLQRSNSFRKATIGSGSGIGSNIGGGSMVLTTVISRFRASLDDLLTTINATETHYIRCIKPNSRKQPDNIEKELIVRQLGCGGIFETVRVIMAGYPTRILIDKLVDHYGCLAMKRSGNNNILAEELLKSVANTTATTNTKIKPYRIGKTKVFLAAGIAAKLDYKRLLLTKAILIVQKRWKRIIQRRKYTKLLVLVRILVSASKTKCCRIKFQQNRKNSTLSTPPTSLGVPPILPTVSPRQPNTTSSQPKDSIKLEVTPRDEKVGWKSGGVSTIVQEMVASHQKEVQTLRSEIDTINNRMKEKDVLLSRLEKIMGTPISGFDTIRDELAKHYEERVKLVTKELTDEKNSRVLERKTNDGKFTMLQSKCELLAKDVEELRSKTEKAKAERKEKKHLESRVKELEKEIDSLRKTTTQPQAQIQPQTQDDGSERYVRATTIVADALKSLVTKIEEYNNNVTNANSRLEPLEEHIDGLKGLPILIQQKQKEILDALSSIYGNSITKTEYTNLQKSISDRLNNHETVFLGQMRHLEEVLSPSTLSQSISNNLNHVIATINSGRTDDKTNNKAESSDKSSQELSKLAEIFGAEEPTSTSIIKAIRSEETERAKAAEEHIQTLVKRYEERIRIMDTENRSVNVRIEQLLANMNNSG